MPYLQNAGNRHGRDRDAFASRIRLGPYEAAYDVRMGYQDAPEAAPRTSAPEPLLFRGRSDSARR